LGFTPSTKMHRALNTYQDEGHVRFGEESFQTVSIDRLAMSSDFRDGPTPPGISEEQRRVEEARIKTEKLQKKLASVARQLQESEDQYKQVEAQYSATVGRKSMLRSSSSPHISRKARRRSLSAAVRPKAIRSNIPDFRRRYDPTNTAPPNAISTPPVPQYVDIQEIPPPVSIPSDNYEPDYLRTGIVTLNMPPPPPPVFRSPSLDALKDEVKHHSSYGNIHIGYPPPRALQSNLPPDRNLYSSPTEMSSNPDEFRGKRDSKRNTVALSELRNRRYTVSNAPKAISYQTISPPPEHSGESSSSLASKASISSTFNAETEASNLKRCLKGWRTTIRNAIDILVNRDPEELHELQDAFLSKYKVSVEKYIKGKTTSSLQTLVVGFVQSRSMMCATYFHKCLDEQNAKGIVDVLTQNTNLQLRRICDAYNEKYADGKGAEQIKRDVRSKTQKGFLRFALQLLSCNREEEVVKKEVDADCRTLYKCSVIDPDPKTIIDLFATRSRIHLRAVNHKYKKWYPINLNTIKSH